MTWLMFPAGVVIATMAMFSGLGGGILWVPLLLSVFDLPPREAVFSALIIQTFGQASAIVSNVRQDLVNWRLVTQQARVAVPFAIIGAFVSRVVQPAWIEGMLGLVTFVIAYVFLRGDDLFEPGGETPDLEAGRGILPVSMIGGILTGLLSVGVGDWLVPLFNKRCRLTMAHSVANGIALMFFLSVIASLSHVALGVQPQKRLIAIGVLGVTIGAQLGSRLHRRVSESRFKELFVLLLIFIAAHVIFNAA